MFTTFSKITMAALVAGLAFTAAAPQAAADEAAIQARQGLMKGVGATMGGLKAVVEGEVPTSAAASLAGAMAGFSQAAVLAFPEGSMGANSRAKAEIWSKPADFNAAVAAFQGAAAGMAAVAKSGDAGAIKAAFGELGKSCGGCHKPFRAPKS